MMVGVAQPGVANVPVAGDAVATGDSRCAADGRAALAFIADVLGMHRQRCARDGIALPPAVEAAWLVATRRQAPPQLASADRLSHVLCVTYEQAGQRLSVSKRSVERLIRSGALPSVEIGGTPRIRVADLIAYVERRPLRPVDRVDSSPVASFPARAANS